MALQVQKASIRLAVLQSSSPVHRPKIAGLVTGSSHCLASQNIEGDKSTVSNLLSF